MNVRLASLISCTVLLCSFVNNVFGQQITPPKESTALELFNSRILPIFKSPDPSSCVQCHLSSVDLKNYILPSHEKTFLSLRDQGLIDLDTPDNSKILTLISMGHKDADAKAKMIHEEMRQAEYEAFAAWIKASVDDKNLSNLPPLKQADLARPSQSDEVIRFTRKSRLINSFARNVWSQRMRCFPCHTEHEIGPNQKNAQDKFDQWYEQYGERMKIFKKTPRETVQYLIDQSLNSGTNLPLLNLDDPSRSLIVVKPTSKLPPLVDGKRKPTYSDPVYHIGGLKMHYNDHSYKAITAWIKDYANVAAGEYKSVEDLPDDNWHPTQKILRIKDIPESWSVGSTIQMFVFPAGEPGKSSTEPIGFTQGTITPRRFANGALILLSPTNQDDFAAWRTKSNKVPEGEYVVKIYVDDQDRLRNDAAAILDNSDFRGELNLPIKTWKPGFRNAQVVSALEIGRKEEKQ